jgi:hypothetical protein
VKVYSAKDLKVAVALSNTRPKFPLRSDSETGQILRLAINPALGGLPSRHDCEAVRLALETMFVMGVAAGIELERGS